MNGKEVTIKFTEREAKITLIVFENFFKGIDGAIIALKNFELVDEFEKIENKIKDALDNPKLNLKLNSNFEKYVPTEEDREEEIREMKESIIGMEGDR